MAPFAVGPFRSRYKNLLSGPPSGSFHHTRGCLKAKQLRKPDRILYQDKCRIQRLELCLLSSPSYKGRLGDVSSKRLCFAHGSNGPYKKYLSDFSFALQCAFWVWLASLSSRLAEDTDACSAALSQARYAMTRVFLRQGLNSKAGTLVFTPPIIIRGGWEGLVARGCALRMARTALMKNIRLISALHFGAPFGYGSLRCRYDSQIKD